MKARYCKGTEVRPTLAEAGERTDLVPNRNHVKPQLGSEQAPNRRPTLAEATMNILAPPFASRRSPTPQRVTTSSHAPPGTAAKNHPWLPKVLPTELQTPITHCKKEINRNPVSVIMTSSEMPIMRTGQVSREGSGSGKSRP